MFTMSKENGCKINVCSIIYDVSFGKDEVKLWFKILIQLKFQSYKPYFRNAYQVYDRTREQIHNVQTCFNLTSFIKHTNCMKSVHSTILSVVNASEKMSRNTVELISLNNGDST